MEDEDFKIYLRRCNEEQEKAKLKTIHSDFCPLLVAKHDQVMAENAFLNSMAEITKAEVIEVNHHREHRKTALDLCLSLMADYVAGDFRE